MSAPEPTAGPAETASPATASAGTAPASGEPGRASGWNDPRLPWVGRPRAIDIACWAGITLSGLYYLLLLPFRAALVGTHPLLLVLLNGSTEGIVVSAAFARVGQGTLVVLLLAAIPGLMKFDPLYWWAGRLWGERLIEVMAGRRKRGPRYLAQLQRWGRRFIWPAVVLCPFLPIPNAFVYVLAGSAGMGLVTFIILDIIGSLLWAGMLAGLGYALGRHAVVVAQVISRYALWFSLAIVAVIVVNQVRLMRQGRVVLDGPDEQPAAEPLPGQRAS